MLENVRVAYVRAVNAREPAMVIQRAANQRGLVIATLGTLQILAYGTTFYLLAVLAKPIVADTGWNYDRVNIGLALGLLVAGVVSPRVGRWIGSHGGRFVLAGGSLAIACGLAIIGTATHYPVYLIGWAVLGAGMGAGLYDAAFATLGELYGTTARGAMTAVTLFGGFASTVCWPASAFLVEQWGWRSACLTYAAIHAFIALPLYVTVLRHRGDTAPAGTEKGRAIAKLLPAERSTYLLLAGSLTLSAAVLSLVGSQLVVMLQGAGLTLAEAVALGMIIGPAAVGARVVEMVAGKRYHPIWTMVASVTLVLGGVALFFVGPVAFAAAIAFYAAGNGIASVAKGTLPMALFGPERYPQLMGRLGLPILFAMALAPYLGALAFESGGTHSTLLLLASIALVNAALVGGLFALTCGRDRTTLN